MWIIYQWKLINNLLNKDYTITTNFALAYCSTASMYHPNLFSYFFGNIIVDDDDVCGGNVN